MALHSYLVEEYKYTHEREAFEELENQLSNYIDETGDDIILVGNLSCNNNFLDAVLFKKDAIIVIEFKKFGGKVKFHENGKWHSEDGAEIKAGKHGNPYLQVHNYRIEFRNFLAQKNIFKNTNLGFISGLLLFQHKISFDPQSIPNNIPWFKMCDLENFIMRVRHRTSKEINISESEFLLIEKKLNLQSTKRNLQTYSRKHIALNSIVSELENTPRLKILLDTYTFVGIDFGTSTTVISYVSFDEIRNKITTKQVPIPFDANGTKEDIEILPSVIYYNKALKKVSISQDAKSKKYEGIYGVNYWSSFKMQLGKDEGNTFTNSELDGKDTPEKILTNKDATRVFLKQIVDYTKSYLVEKGLPNQFKFCVSIPASFEANQRQDLFDAICEAGIEKDPNVFIDEPNAAFLSYLTTDENGFIHSMSRTFTLVFDFGAGTCDISVIEVGEKAEGYYSRNIAISKFEEIGGDNIDSLIAKKILFPSLCKIASLDINTISDVEYQEYFERKLMSLAEMFKITFSNKINQDSSLRNKSKEISKEPELVFNFRGEKFKLEDITMSYKDFEKVMLEFIDNKSDKTIIKAVRSALNKSRLSEDAIDNILFVGGSCLNPYIVECVSALLPDASKIIPRNLQTHVSSGSAINCFLVKGLQINPLTPIISEPISVKTKDERTVVIIDSGTEIPSKGFIVDGFKLSNKDQKIIEIPIYVSGSKLLQTTRINLEGIKLIDESIRIESEVDANKIITIKVFLGKVLLDSSLVQPFANEVLTTYQLEVKKIIRRINNSSALKDKGQISIEINKLVELHSKYNNHNEAFNTLVKYSPESYTALCYHAIKARLTSQRFYYAKLAYDLDKNGTSIFNYALGFPENSTEYEALLREGAEGYNDMHAKLHLGILLKSKGQMETAISLIEEAYNFYYSIYSGRKRGLAEWEYNGLKHCCIHLSKPELLKEIENILLLLKRNSDETKPYDSNNLLEYGSDIPKTGN